ncbi:MAG TPA: gluconokinase [Edaphobacter sp.]
MIVVLMGVTGSGKSTIGALLVQRTGAVFADGDDYHPEANKAKMAAGQPLTDEDRQPWLEALNRVMRGWYEAGKSGVIACSALKEKYRDTLSVGIPEGDLRFVWLDGPKALIAKRLAGRHHEFMNSSLLDSQFAALELPTDALRIEVNRDPEEIVDQILERVPLMPTAKK